MTLGPTRSVIARWLSEPFYEADKGGGGGAGAGAGGDGKTGDDGKGGTNADGSTGNDGKGGDKSGAGTDGATAKGVVVEIEGKKYVLQDHVNELVGTARTEGEKRGKDAVEQAAKEKLLKEQGDFKALYEESEKKRLAAEAERDEANLATLRRTIGEKHGLSAKVSSRLTGKTEKEIEADAKEMAAELGVKPGESGTRKSPDTEGGNGSKVKQRGGSQGNGSEGGESGNRDKKPKRPFVFQSEGDVKRW